MAAVGGDLVRTAEWHRVRDFAQEVRASPAALAIQGEAGWLHAYVPRAPHDDHALAGLRARMTGAAFRHARAHGRSLNGTSAVRYALEENAARSRQPEAVLA